MTKILLKFEREQPGKYKSDCGVWVISKTHTRSGWRVYNLLTKWHGYAPTLRQAEDMANFNNTELKQ